MGWIGVVWLLPLTNESSVHFTLQEHSVETKKFDPSNFRHKFRPALASEHIRMELDQMKISRGWSHTRSLITIAARLVFFGTVRLALCLQMQGMMVGT